MRRYKEELPQTLPGLIYKILFNKGRLRLKEILLFWLLFFLTLSLLLIISPEIAVAIKLKIMTTILRCMQ